MAKRTKENKEITGAFLKGKKIYLRKITEKDAGKRYLSWINDADITKGIYTGLYPTSLKELQEYVKVAVSSSNNAMFAICDINTNLHIGNIKLESFDFISHTCGLGIIIGDKSYWGKGVGQEACSLVIDYAFNKLNFRKVTLIVFSNNIAAFNLYKKLGFEVEGILKKHIFCEGQYVDKIYMSVFNPNTK